MTRRKRYSRREAEDYLEDVFELMRQKGDGAFRGLKLRKCSEYHYQFWQEKRCLLNVWPSQRRYQLAEMDEPSAVGDPVDVVAALMLATRVKRKGISRSSYQRVAQAISSLSRFLVTQDSRALQDASSQIQSIEDEFFGMTKKRPQSEEPEELDELEYEEGEEVERHDGKIFG